MSILFKFHKFFNEIFSEIFNNVLLKFPCLQVTDTSTRYSIRHIMADTAAADADVMMTSPGRRTADFSINSLLSSPTVNKCRNDGPTDKRTDRHPPPPDRCSDVSDISADLLRRRLAAAALWYPWLHGVASLQSVNNRHHLSLSN